MKYFLGISYGWKQENCNNGPNVWLPSSLTENSSICLLSYPSSPPTRLLWISGMADLVFLFLCFALLFASSRLSTGITLWGKQNNPPGWDVVSLCPWLEHSEFSRVQSAFCHSHPGLQIPLQISKKSRKQAKQKQLFDCGQQQMWLLAGARRHHQTRSGPALGRAASYRWQQCMTAALWAEKNGRAIRAMAQN